MEGKKKYFALVIFLFLGLMVFTFANPAEEETEFTDGGSQITEKENTTTTDEDTTEDDGQETQNVLNNVTNQNTNTNNTTTVTDTSLADAIAAVEKAEGTYTQEDVDAAKKLVNNVTDTTEKGELENRLAEVEAGIAVDTLLAELENKVEEAANKDDMNTATDYRDENEIANKIAALTNETVAEALQARLDEVSKLLDDNAAPVITGVEDGKAYAENTTITVEDAAGNAFTVTMLKDGEEVNIEDGYTTIGEGVYTLTVVDEAFNEATVTFTVDMTDPKFVGITNGGHYDEVTVNVEDLTNVTITITNMDTNETTTVENGIVLTEEATYKLVATDEAGNITTYYVAIDKTAPTISGVTNNSYVNKSENAYIRDKFLTLVTVTATYADGTTSYEEFTRADFTVGARNENFELKYKATKEGTYTIYAEDKYGNNYSETFTIDRTAAEIVSANMYSNGNKYTEDKNTVYYTTNGNTITAYIRVSEQLKDVPSFTFEVGNTLIATTDVTEAFHKAEDEEAGIYRYQTTLIVDEYDFDDGDIKLTVSDIIDKAGNQTADVTSVTNKNIVRIDRTKAARVYSTIRSSKTAYETDGVKYYYVKNGEEFEFAISFDELLAEVPTVTIAGRKVEMKLNEKVLNNENKFLYEGTFTIAEDETELTEGTLEIKVTNIKDLAGNETELADQTRTSNSRTVIYDRTAPVGTVTTSNKNGLQSTNKDVTATLITEENVETPEGWTVVTEGTEFTKVYSENVKDSVVITDKAGNEATIKYEVKRIDKVAPVVTVVDPNKYQMEVNTEYVEKGYSAWDEVDKDVTNLIKITYQFQAQGTSAWPFVDELDTSKLGTYKVIYTAYDKAGNTAKGTRVVQIVDTTSPLITLNGEQKITLEAGIDTYEELGATVTDNYDETISNLQPEYIHYRDKDNNLEKVTSVDTTKVGTYKIVYKHTDTNGNVGKDSAGHEYAMRVVTVQDTTAPVVTTNQDKDISLEAGIDTYKELGAVVTDNVDATYTLEKPSYINHYTLDGTYTGRVTEVDTTVIGKYLLVYTATDSNGNASNNQLAQSKKWVIVQDTINPTLTVKEESVGTDPYYSKISFSLKDSNKIDYFEVNGTKFDRTDAKYSDANYQNIKSVLVEGKNIIVLYDTAGNKTEKEFYMDWTNPTIDVKEYVGSNPYSGMSFKLSDNYAIDYFVLNGTEYDRTNAKYSDANYQNIKSALVNGENTLVLYDAAGNSTTYKFTLDRVAPTITVKESSVGIDNLYSQLDLQLYDSNKVASVVINETQLPHNGKYVDINDGHAYTFRHGENVIVVTDTAGNVTTKTFNVTKFNLKVENGVANLNSDVTLINKPFYNVKENTSAVTINGNGHTVEQKVTSEEMFNWTENYMRTTMGNIFSSANASKITVNDITFTGTTQSILLGHYQTTNQGNFNTEFNNVNMIGLNVVSLSANIAPGAIVYGNATLNNTNIYGTKLSSLETAPKWTVYDLAVVNFTNTTINGGKVGTIYTWAKARLEINNAKIDTITSAIRKTNDFQDGELIIGSGTKVNKIIVTNAKAVITIKAGATVDTIDFNGLDQSAMTIVIEDGATVNNQVA